MNRRRNHGAAIKLLAALLAAVFALLALGCGGEKRPTAEVQSQANKVQAAGSEKKAAPNEKSSSKEKPSSKEEENDGAYRMKDIKKLKGTERFSRNGLEHIFSGTVNKKGKATGYHYSRVEDSAGSIIEGTRSRKDKKGVFTAKVEVDGVKKDGFSSFYPESWTPQKVVDAINEAYDDAMKNPKNPKGSLWIGHSGNLEIHMYLDEHKKILTAYPVYSK